MKTDDINELLAKYYEGETSLEEEKLLNEVLSRSEDSSHEEEKILFEYMNSHKDSKLPDRFDDGLRDLLVSDEKKTKTLRWSILTGIAATFILIVGIADLLMDSEQSMLVETKSESQFFTLEDGTDVWLNRRSSLKFIEKFNEEYREVQLIGEAFFDVKRDTNRPFIINTGYTQIRVLGTSFNVRSYPNENTTEVLVVSGKVSLSDKKGQDKIMLEKDESGRWMENTGSLTKSTLSDYNDMAWRTKRFEFDNHSLKDVFADMESFFDIRLKIENKELLNCHMTAQFNDPSIEDVFDVLRYTNDLSFVKDEEFYIISGEGCSEENP